MWTASVARREPAGRAVEHLAQRAILEKHLENARQIEEHQRMPGGLEVDQNGSPALVRRELRHAVERHDLVHAGSRHEQPSQRAVFRNQSRDGRSLRREVM